MHEIKSPFLILMEEQSYLAQSESGGRRLWNGHERRDNHYEGRQQTA